MYSASCLHKINAQILKHAYELIYPHIIQSGWSSGFQDHCIYFWSYYSHLKVKASFYKAKIYVYTIPRTRINLGKAGAISEYDERNASHIEFDLADQDAIEHTVEYVLNELRKS